MKAIYASKFYKASSRQEGIRAAINDPINRELVQQLREYIDDDELERIAQKPADSEDSSVEEKPADSEASDTDNLEDNEQIRKSSGSKIPANHHLSDMMKQEEGDSEGSVPPESSGEPTESDNASEESITVSESTNVEDTAVSGTDFGSITASASLLNIHACVDISEQVDSIAGILNATAETAGVRRCMVKPEDELWIYYNDSINLNNVMEPVISLLNASDYGHLDFNRLARTDNAIVFSISKSVKPMEPVQETDEK